MKLTQSILNIAEQVSKILSRNTWVSTILSDEWHRSRFTHTTNTRVGYGWRPVIGRKQTRRDRGTG